MKAVPINSCKLCPHFRETPYPTMDSFERPSYWWCVNPNVKEDDSNVADHDKQHIESMRTHYDKVKKIQGYVEWHEEKGIKIPKWCPLTEI